MTFNDLVGHTIQEISGAKLWSPTVRIRTDKGTYVLEHNQDCCESVAVAEVHGDPEELVGEVVVFANESSSSTIDPPGRYVDHFTWTFYRLMTKNHTLVLRWLGESNGYYSEVVDFREEASA